MGTPSRKQRRASRDLFLGIDGGGTKTHTVLFSADGKLLAEDTSGPSNPLRTGLASAAETLLGSAAAAVDSIGRTTDGIVSVFAGLAGVRRKDQRAEVRRLIARGFENARVTVVTDAEIALHAATGGKPGVVVIAGTGSIVFGRNSRGRTALAGGWGPIAGDEGAGVSIAREALRAVARASDGRGPKTALSELAAEYFRAGSAEDLIVAIYSPQMTYTKLAGFARSVAQAADEGDETARTILRNAGKELGLAVCAVIRQLGMERSKVNVGTVGGVFRSGELVKRSLMAELRTCAPAAGFVEPKISPAEAAAELAIAQFYQSPSR